MSPLHSSLKSSGASYPNCRPSTATRLGTTSSSSTGTPSSAAASSTSAASTSHPAPAHHQSPTTETNGTTSTSHPTEPPVEHLDEPQLHALITAYKRSRTPATLTHPIVRVFSSFQSLAGSFRKRPPSHLDQLLERAPADLRSLKKEDLRSLEGDLDKDEDDSAEAAAAACASDSDDGASSDDAPPAGTDAATTTVDLPSLRRCLHRLYDTYTPAFETLNESLYTLALQLKSGLAYMTRAQIAEAVDVFLIVFETIAVAASEFVDQTLPAVCAAACLLPTWAQAQLARNWAALCTDSMRPILQALQQLISLQVGRRLDIFKIVHLR